MALPTTPATSWMSGMDLPSRFFEFGSDDYELYEQEDEFVLSVELPGFDPEEISVSWHEGVLNISGEHEDDRRGTQRTYHRRFRFPKTIDEDVISAEYKNGVLEVHLPIEGTQLQGTEIEVEA